MTESHAWALGAVVCTAAAHALLKQGSRHPGRPLWRVYANPWTLSGYALMAAVTLMSLQAFRGLPLKAALVIQPLILMCVAAVSVTVFGERLSRRQWTGAGVILLGVIVYGL